MLKEADNTTAHLHKETVHLNAPLCVLNTRLPASVKALCPPPPPPRLCYHCQLFRVHVIKLTQVDDLTFQPSPPHPHTNILFCSRTLCFSACCATTACKLPFAGHIETWKLAACVAFATTVLVARAQHAIENDDRPPYRFIFKRGHLIRFRVSFEIHPLNGFTGAS